MTCTGNGARLLAAVIGVHGDDFGLVLPPKIAPIQVVIIPIFNDKNKDSVLEEANKIMLELSDSNIRVFLDDSDESVGSKFYDWELKGVPVRIEIGQKEIDKGVVCVVRRDLRKREFCNRKDIINFVKEQLSNLEQILLNNYKNFLDERIVDVKDMKELKSVLKDKKVARVHWCGSPDCWDKIKGVEEGVELFGTDLKEGDSGKCVVCGKETKQIGFVGNTY